MPYSRTLLQREQCDPAAIYRTCTEVVTADPDNDYRLPVILQQPKKKKTLNIPKQEYSVNVLIVQLARAVNLYM